MATKNSKQWQINLKHAVTRKLKTVKLPGGLQEAEARRSALLKAGAYWQVIGAHHVDLAGQATMDRNVALCCQVL